MPHDVIVIGLGAMGSAVLYQLARAGVRALGIDRFNPPHDRGSSHGETRITRCGVGEGEAYVPLAMRSHEIWRELEEATGRELLLECGFLAIDGAPGAIFHGRSSFFDCTRSGAERFGVEHEEVTPDEARRRFPQFRLRGHERLYFEPGGGLVFPERCIAAQLEQATALGAEIRSNERVVDIRTDQKGIVVETERGRFSAGRAVLAAGGWTPSLARGALARMRLLRQVLHWFAPADAGLYGADRCPTYIWAHGSGPEDNFYGFPLVPGATPGVKVATEQYGIELSIPEDMQRRVEPGESGWMFDVHVSGRLAEVNRNVLKSISCFYTQAPDSDFVLDLHPASERIVLVSACSGHGFKHSAGVGELVSRWLYDGVAPPAAFSLLRPALG